MRKRNVKELLAALDQDGKPALIRSVCVVIPRDSKYACIRQVKRGGRVEFPGGKVNPGEKIRAAAKREVLEEVGVHVKNLKPLYTVVQNIGGKSFLCTIFVGTIPDHQELVSSPEGEAFWGTKEEALSGPFGDMNQCALSMIELGVIPGCPDY